MPNQGERKEQDLDALAASPCGELALPRTVACGPASDHVPADAVLDRVTDAVNEICRSATLDLAYRVGKIIIDELFDGSVDVWTRDGTGRPSYRKLAARGDLLLSPSALCRAVSVHALCERLGGRSEWKRLGGSHFQEVLPLDPEQQRTLLLSAEREGWSVAQLRTEVARRRPAPPRRTANKFVRLMKRFGSVLSTEKTVLLRPETLAELDDEAAEQLSSAVAALHAQLAELEETIGEVRRASDVMRVAEECGPEQRLASSGADQAERRTAQGERGR